MKRFRNLHRLIFFAGAWCTLVSGLLWAEEVEITTYYPQPYANHRRIEVNNSNESATLTNFTSSLVNAGLNIITEYNDNTYTPGIFWSSSNDNADKPKAGIWMHQAVSVVAPTNRSTLLFGTSNNFGNGIQSATNLMVLDENGRLGLGGVTDPVAQLDVFGVGAHGMGSAAAPSFSFRTELDTGMWSSGAGTLNFSTGGVERARINSAGNVGVMSTYNPGSAPSNNANGNLDANDVYLRNAARWASAGPKASGSYTGTGTNLPGYLFIPTGFHPTYVITWNRHVGLAHIHLQKTWEGLTLKNSSGTTLSADYSLSMRQNLYVEQTGLRIVAGEDGFRVSSNDSHHSNAGGVTYFWYAWD